VDGLVWVKPLLKQVATMLNGQSSFFSLIIGVYIWIRNSEVVCFTRPEG
jgi:hypothetical protein